MSRRDVTSSVPPPGPSPEPSGPSADAARWLIVLAYSTGLAGLYALASLAHAAFVERIFSVDVAFGRGLAFWVGTIYLALLAWGFLPARPTGWYARRRLVLAALAIGLAGAAICGVYTMLWLADHWAPGVSVPVAASIAGLLMGALAVLWLAGRDERKAAPPR